MAEAPLGWIGNANEVTLTSISLGLCSRKVKPYNVDMMSQPMILTAARLFDGRRLRTFGAIAIQDGRIKQIGPLADINASMPPGTPCRDFGDGWLLPGFFDAHMHPLWLGLSLGQPNLAACRDLQMIADCLAADTGQKLWHVARGLDESRLSPPQMPDRSDLDKISPDRPLLLLRVCEHAGVVNSAGLRAASISDDIADPNGGSYGRDSAGRLDGRLYETALWRLEAQLPRPDAAEKAAALRRAGRHLIARGITGVVEAAAGMLDGMADLQAYRAAADSGDLPQRCAMLALAAPDGLGDALDSLRPGQGDRRLWLSGLKYFTDGTIGARTAAVSAPYLNGGHGALTLDSAWLHQEIAARHCAGWPLAFHAIGDRAVKTVLAALESCAEHQRIGPPHRLEHAMMLDDADLAVMARLGVHPVPQPIFLHAFGPMYQTALGAHRAARLIPMRAMCRAGLDPAASSDAPIAPAEPLINLRSMLTRRDHSGQIRGGDQRLSLTAALAAMTAAGPASLGRAKDFGRLLPGYPADIIALDRPPSDPAAAVVMTMVDGFSHVF